MNHVQRDRYCIPLKHPGSFFFQVPDVFYFASRAVLHPTFPLFDQEKQCLKPRLRRAVQRIFNLCDHDLDGALNDAELNDFQVRFLC